MDNQYRNSSGKIIGKISGDVFCRNVKKSKHLLRKWNAFGIDKAVLDNLIRNGIQKIKVHETEEDIDYETSIKDFVEKGIEAEFANCGKQIFLPLENFDKKDIKQNNN
jgi:hypothetical protein